MSRFFSKLFAAPVAPAANKARLGLGGIGLEERKVMSVTTQTGTTDFGASWSFTYDNVAKVGTFTVTGSDNNLVGDNFALTERFNNLDQDDPGYNPQTANLPVGIDIVEQGTGRTAGSPNFLPGSTINIVVNARKGDDSIANDTRYASTMDGGDGNDYLRGSNTANDLLVGGTGNDTLEGRGGNDDLWGDRRVRAGDGTYYSPVTGAGNDTLIGGLGNDTLRGGDGKDQLWGDDRVVVQVRKQVGTMNLFGHAIPIYGQVSEYASGSTGGNDLLIGGDGSDYSVEVNDNDVLVGGAGDDTLQGGRGDDWLFGGAGNDTLEGGYGNDHHFGGTGTDFIFDDPGSDNHATGTNDPDWAITQWGSYVG